jgi:large subunit ribosomal protein L5
MTINVTLERPGFRTKRRAHRRTAVGRAHGITKAEAIRFIKQRFPVEISGVDAIGEAEAA